MTQTDIDTLSNVASQSFLSDILYTTTVKDEAKRKSFLYHLMKFRLTTSNKSDIIVADKMMRGACVWRDKNADFTIKDVLACKSLDHK